MKIFDLDFRNWSYIESVSKEKGVATWNLEFKKSEKGMVLYSPNTTSTLTFGNDYNIVADDFFIDIILKPTAWNDGKAFFTRQKDANNYVVLTDYQDKCSISIRYNGTYYTASCSLSLNKFTHIGIEWDVNTKTAIIYKNNFDETEVGSALNTGSGDDVIVINGYPAGNYSCVGYIGGVSVFNSKLSSQERNNLHQEFLHSYGTTEQKRHFTYPKATDLSNEVDSNIGKNIVINWAFSINLAGWGSYNIMKNWEDGYVKITTTSAYGALIQTFPVVKWTKYKINWKTKSNSGDTWRIRIDATGIPTFAKIWTNTEWETFTSTFIADGTGTAKIWLQWVYSGDVVYYDDIIIQEVTGLQAAYNMIPSSDWVLIDISGNGNNWEINGAISTKDGIKFDGVDDKITITNNTLQNIKTRDLTIVGRFKCLGVSGEDYLYGTSSIGSTTGVGLTMGSAGTIRSRPFSAATLYTDNSYDDGQWHTFVQTLDRDGDAILYIDTIPVLVQDISSYSANSLSTGNWYIGAENGSGGFLNGEFSDAKTYTGLWTKQQILAYHNSFNKLTLRNTFKDEWADGVVKTPRDFIKGTGDYKVEELAIKQGELVTNGDFANGTSYWSVASGWTISNWVAKGDWSIAKSLLAQNIGLLLGKTYKIEFDVLEINGSIRVYFWNTGLNYRFSTAWHHSIIGQTSDSSSLYIRNDIWQTVTIDNISVIEVPPLPEYWTWIKYLQNTVAGTISTQSKQAYGEWEFDIYKSDDRNSIIERFISMTQDGTGDYNGYFFQIYTTEALFLYRKGLNLFKTQNGYIKNNTWYRIKIARLQNEGIFKDIPRLNPDKDLETMTSPNDYTITDVNSYGGSFSADGTKNCYGATANSSGAGFDFTTGDIMKVSFDLNLISGTAPEFLLMQTLGSGSSSIGYRSVDGHNELYITATASRSNGVLGFRNTYEATEFIMSGLKVEKVYKANTFAVFIKGGSFGNEYTLVDTTGGSRTNPVTDSTYTESEYFVADLDVGDKISNIKLQSQVQQ